MRFLKVPAIAIVVMLLFVPGAIAGEPDFYDAPTNAPAEPGVLLKMEPFTRGVPAGAKAWRILYTTTAQNGRPAVSSGLVLAPADPPLGPRPVITWTHGTTGVVPHCAPSLLPVPFEVPAVQQVVASGWVVVMSDYPGLGTDGRHGYLVGEAEARASLDAYRAAKSMREVSLQDGTVVWGHSQGGHAALWTGAIAGSYAPEVRVLGVAAMAPASDLVPLVSKHLTTGIGQVLISYIATAYSATYPDVKYDDVVRPAARELAKSMANLCFSPPEALQLLPLVAQVPSVGPLMTAPPAALVARLQENAALHPVPAPLLIAQGLTDVVAFPDVQDGFVEKRCGDGQTLEYWKYPGLDHGGVVAQDSRLEADLMQWTKDRFAGVPQPQGCHTVDK